MRIEMGVAFADLLNEKGNGSGEIEMGYVERTLGFRIRDLEDRDLRLILRIGFFEIVKLNMPPYAVVDENVDMVLETWSMGFSGSLLYLRKVTLFLYPKWRVMIAHKHLLLPLYSHPVWMVRGWTKHLGQEETIKLMTWNNSDPSFSLRANSGKGFSRADLVTKLNLLKVPHEISLHLNDFVYMKKGLQIVIQAGLLKECLCSVQDESAEPQTIF